MITTFVLIVVVVAIASLALWVIAQFPNISQPIGKVAKIAIVVIAVLLIIMLAASLFGVDIFEGSQLRT